MSGQRYDPVRESINNNDNRNGNDDGDTTDEAEELPTQQSSSKFSFQFLLSGNSPNPSREGHDNSNNNNNIENNKNTNAQQQQDLEQEQKNQRPKQNVRGSSHQPLIRYNPVRRNAPKGIQVPLAPGEEQYLKSLRKNPLRQGPPNGYPEHEIPMNPREAAPSNYNSNNNNFNKRKNYPDNDSDLPKRTKAEEGVLVADHYNNRPNTNVHKRNESPIIGLKKLNNWIKQVLIGKFSRDPNEVKVPLQVLDIGCGKGGDLQKWLHNGTSLYAGLDIADISIRDAQQRYNRMRKPKFAGHFFAVDCYKESIERYIPPDVTFDVVSMQFCLHYAFQTEQMARTMLENVVRHLKVNGRFLFTIPDSRILLAKLDDLPEDADPLQFGNEMCHITFDDRNNRNFGHRYTFYLQDAVDEVPEYVVPWEFFKELASEYGLEHTFSATFHEVFEDASQEEYFKNLMTRMGVVDSQGESQLDEDMWEAADYYLAAAFTKVR